MKSTMCLLLVLVSWLLFPARGEDHVLNLKDVLAIANQSDLRQFVYSALESDQSYRSNGIAKSGVIVFSPITRPRAVMLEVNKHETVSSALRRHPVGKVREWASASNWSMLLCKTNSITVCHGKTKASSLFGKSKVDIGDVIIIDCKYE